MIHFYKKPVVLFLLCLITVFAFSQATSKYVTDARNADNVKESISILTEALKKNLDSKEKLEVLTFLASLQEQLGEYETACTNYSLASNLSASINQNSGKQPVADEEYLLGIVRCALSYGDTNTADYILSTAFSGNESKKAKDYTKLYAVWSWLCKVEDSKEVLQPLAILQSYLQVSSLSDIKPAVLLTL